jgi:hypothetical protein
MLAAGKFDSNGTALIAIVLIASRFDRDDARSAGSDLEITDRNPPLPIVHGVFISRSSNRMNCSSGSIFLANNDRLPRGQESGIESH